MQESRDAQGSWPHLLTEAHCSKSSSIRISQGKKMAVSILIIPLLISKCNHIVKTDEMQESWTCFLQAHTLFQSTTMHSGQEVFFSTSKPVIANHHVAATFDASMQTTIEASSTSKA
uniref:Uncharacterized protein n=1 Tax=Rhipicephalus microplus TaxID=6941 RepID=A0A6G5AHU8_RHIMP